VPSAALLNGAGDTATVDLRKVDVDGTDYDVDPPAGVALQILGSTTAFDTTDLGGGRLRLTATGQSGTTVRIATVPGQATKAELTVTAAELQPGVVEIADSQVLYPPPGVPAGFTPGTTSLPGFSATGPGPFTWEEFRARIASLPATVAPTSELVLGGDQRFPAVLRGPAPAAGTLVIGNGAAAIYGEVVEPSGLPTLERDGYSMVSLRLAALPDVFADLTYDIDLEEYFAATDPAAAAPVGAGRVGGSALALPARPVAAGAAGLVAGAPVSFVTADAPASSPCSTTLAVPNGMYQ
jgi:hypothetical protein